MASSDPHDEITRPTESSMTFRAEDAKTAANTSASEGALLTQSTEPKRRDLWDKAPVITSVLSSVVLALVGLYVSSTFQASQLAITRENNASQLAITAQKNQADLRLQELKLTSDLLESLVSSDAKKKRVATLMLPSALSNHEMCQQILAALADDADQGVRVAALNKLGGGNTVQAARLLENVQRDSSRPQQERQLARDLATKVALNSNLPSNSGFLFASVPGGIAYETSTLQGGVFTHSLVEGLAGAADANRDGQITIGELAQYVEERMPQAVAFDGLPARGVSLAPILKKPDERFKPFLELSGSPSLVVVDLKNGMRAKRFALVVGVSAYSGSFMPLRFATQDAERMYDRLFRQGVTTTKLLNPTHTALVDELNRILNSMNDDDVFYFYFSGHGWSVGGENFLGPRDAALEENGVRQGFSLEELKSALQKSRHNSVFAFFDVCRNELLQR
jgi:uncharacterized caspase-like protein